MWTDIGPPCVMMHRLDTAFCCACVHARTAEPELHQSMFACVYGAECWRGQVEVSAQCNLM